MPDNGCFEITIVRNFQKRHLRKEIAAARGTVREHEKDLPEARDALSSMCPTGLLPSVSLYTRLELRRHKRDIRERHSKKLHALSNEQEKPLLTTGNNVRVLGDLQIPSFVRDFLSMGPRHPVWSKFDGFSFMADMDRCLKDMQRSEPELLNELNAAAVWYRKQTNSFTVDRTLGKVSIFLKKSGIKAVPFDKGLGFFA